MKIQVFTLFVLLSSLGAYAQRDYTFEKEIQWKGTKNIKIDDKVVQEKLYFLNAENLSDKGFMPYYYHLVELGENEIFDGFDITPISETILDKNFLSHIDKGNVSSEYDYFVEQKIIKRKKYVGVYFLPLKISNNQVIQLNKLSFTVKTKAKSNSAREAAEYAEHSVLSSGSWYKIAVDKNGVYKLTPSDFTSMGLSVTDPRNIRIYGYGGGMLPEVAGTIEFDDLEENAIYVKGESDGSFDADDYILFYGSGQTTWELDEEKGIFIHNENIYTNKTYYFVNVDKGPGERIEDLSSASNSNKTITTFNDYAYHETNDYNLAKSGRVWFGEKFTSSVKTKSFALEFPNIVKQMPIVTKIEVAGASNNSTKFNYTIDGNSYTSSSMGAKNKYVPARIATNEYSFLPQNDQINLELEYNYTDAEGWLNYIEINAYRDLKIEGDQMLFRSIGSIGSGNISKFVIQGGNTNYAVWDITKPTSPANQQLSVNGGNIEFATETESLKEFIVFNNTEYLTPSLVESIENQNLHGLKQCDMVIATHKDFVEEAQMLADHHTQKDGLVVHVIELQDIYNEFSSGSQDIAAIRNLMKMFYDRSSTQGHMPKYLLLFGDGSYDFFDRIANNTNYVPAYQSYESLNNGHFSYVSDDFFGILDDGEGGLTDKRVLDGAIDIGVGRIPVQTRTEAEEAIQKIFWYTADENLVDPETNFNGTISNFAGWRNMVCFSADNSSGNSYLDDSEELATHIDTSYPVYNFDKIYLDAFEKISTPGGNRYPGAKEALNKRFNRGALIINYLGHGGELGLAHERILEISDINSWTNKYNLPLFYTQTCELSRFDDPERESAGEMIYLKPDGGAIAMVTTTRPTYANSTMTMARVFFSNAFDPGKSHFKSVGELYQIAKASNGVAGNSHLVGMVLLGDPAITLAYPKFDVITTEVNGNPITLQTDTLKALGKVTIKGYIEDESFQQQTGFNGVVYPVVYDKPSIYTTLGQDGNEVYPFKFQKNIIYKGKASVQNGEFEFSFYVPKDIAYQYGKGKISYYTENGEIDGNGYSTEIIVGGSEENYDPDIEGPEIELYMNDTNFVSGGTTNENPVLLAYLSDVHGINTVGTGIGHDIKAVLDGDLSNPINLNDFYEADLDSYSSGVVRYQLTGLSNGRHTIELTAWDIFNNSSQASIEFYVRNSDEIAMEKVKTFPNPFAENITFEFEHNQAEESMSLRLDIYTPLGKLVRRYEQKISPYGFLIQPVNWDGKSESGLQVEDGVYFYTMTLQNSNGRKEEYTNKIVKIK